MRLKQSDFTTDSSDMRSTLLWAFSLGFGPAYVVSSDDLVCGEVWFCTNNQANGTIDVEDAEISYDKSTEYLDLSFSGSSDKEMQVYANIVMDFGTAVFKSTFDPCKFGLYKLCPVPAGSFGAGGEIPIPERYASNVGSSISVRWTLIEDSSQVESEFELLCVETTLRAPALLTTANKADIGFPVSIVAIFMAALAILMRRWQTARPAEREVLTYARAELPIKRNERPLPELPQGDRMEMSGLGRPAELEHTMRHELEGNWHGYGGAGVR